MKDQFAGVLLPQLTIKLFGDASASTRAVAAVADKEALEAWAPWHSF
jgi:hypothetical protein